MLKLLNRINKISTIQECIIFRKDTRFKVTSKNVTMIDISNKKLTERTATAEATLSVPKIVLEEIKLGQIKKGDIITTSQVAGIIGAKKTSELLPLCHNIKLSNVHIDIVPDYEKGLISVVVLVKASEEKTGVEMEALTSACVSALNIYDMCKYLSHDITITNVRLLKKSGGKSDYNVL